MKHDPLFDWATTQPAKAPEPVVIPTGEQLRDKGIKTVLSNNGDWKDRFYDAAATVLARDGHVSSDEVVVICGMPEGHPSAVGAAMRTFAVRHKLTKSAYVKSKRPSCHAAVVALWK